MKNESAKQVNMIMMIMTRIRMIKINNFQPARFCVLVILSRLTRTTI